ncbi:MAG TPA: hypothetical protein VLI93_00440, partial [Acetobacteraceae bacterium]|nr:hypothetical protein [Acetobacteraceae bacterium]
RTRPAIPAIAAGVLGLLVLGGGGWWFAMRPVPPTHLAASLPAGRLSAPRETGSTVIAAPVTTPAQINGTAPAQVTTHAPEQQVARREPPTAPPATTGARPSEVSPGITTEIAPGTASLGVASQPTSEQVAALALGNVRQQIEQALDDARCALVNGVVQDSGTVTVTGMAGREADDALRSQVTDLAAPRAVDWRVQRVDPVFCAALKAIHPVSPMAGARDEGLRLGLAGGISTLRDRDLILPRLTMAKFSGQLRVDYIARDRSLEHMYPRVADPAQKLIAIPAQILRPGQRLEIGNPAPGHPQWDVGPPYGTDMIIAVASSGPLFDSPPARNAEANGSEYLLKLGVAIEAARRNGADVTATVMLVDTTP